MTWLFQRAGKFRGCSIGIPDKREWGRSQGLSFFLGFALPCSAWVSIKGICIMRTDEFSAPRQRHLHPFPCRRRRGRGGLHLLVNPTAQLRWDQHREAPAGPPRVHPAPHPHQRWQGRPRAPTERFTTARPGQGTSPSGAICAALIADQSPALTHPAFPCNPRSFCNPRRLQPVPGELYKRVLKRDGGRMGSGESC